MLCQVPVHWMKKVASFKFTVFLMVLFKNKLDMLLPLLYMVEK